MSKPASSFRSSKYSNRFRRLAAPLNHLEDCLGVHYRLQVNCYKYPFRTCVNQISPESCKREILGSKAYFRTREKAP